MMAAGMMQRPNVSLEQHLKDEREAYANLALLNIQMDTLLDRFHREWLSLDSRRQKLVDELEHHGRAIRGQRFLLERTLFPPELNVWLQASVLEAGESAVAFDAESRAQYEPYCDTSCSCLPTTGGRSLALFEEAVARQIVYWQEGEGECSRSGERPAPSRLERVTPQPELLLRRCFLPYKDKTTTTTTTSSSSTHGGTWRRRGVGGDVIVMRSPEPSVGRVLVSMHMVHRGDTIMVETPLFTSPVEVVNADDEKFLPPSIREVMALVQRQTAVFTAQGWDARLLRPFYNWLSEIVFGEERGVFVQCWDEIGCPVEDIDPSLLSRLSELAHFLWMSLPSSLSSEVGNEERVLLFLVSLMTNAMSYGGGVSETEGVALGFLEKGIAVFGGLSLIEHSCRPNAVVVFRQGCTTDSVLSAELRATRSIAIGERITIAYVPTYIAREERQKQLRKKFFFTCACEHCTYGTDTTRLMLTAGGPRDAKEVMLISPRGGGFTWLELVLCRAPHSLKETGNQYRYNDTCVLDALRDEVAFRQETDAVDFASSDKLSTAVAIEVERLRSVLRMGSSSLVSPFHHLFLLRVLQLVGFVRSKLLQLDTAKIQGVLSFLRELLCELIAVFFVLPDWFIPELLHGEARCVEMGNNDLRERLLEDISSEKDTRRKSWQGRIVAHTLLESHGTLAISICECYAALCEEVVGSDENTMNAWTACVLLLRHGLCQHASERCLRAQMKALQYHRRCFSSSGHSGLLQAEEGEKKESGSGGVVV